MEAREREILLLYHYILGATGRATAGRSLLESDIPTLISSKISDFTGAAQSAAQLLRLDQFVAPMGDISFGGQELTNVAVPEAATSATNRSWVESYVAGQIETALTSALSYKGVADASAADAQTATGKNSFRVGDLFRVSIAGSTAFGQPLNVGDYVVYRAANTWDKFDNTDPSITSTTPGALEVAQTGTGNYTLQIRAQGAIGFNANGLKVQVDDTTIVDSGSLMISPTYAGQASIQTLGTINTGIWNATEIGISKGGTGATTAQQALLNLGAVGSITSAAPTLLTQNQYSLVRSRNGSTVELCALIAAHDKLGLYDDGDGLIQISVMEENIQLGNLGGRLPIAKGGTGQTALAVGLQKYVAGTGLVAAVPGVDYATPSDTIDGGSY